MLRNRIYARHHDHTESCGRDPVIVYVAEEGRHGNFYSPAYQAISARPEWMRRFSKVHSQFRSLPKSQRDPARRWRELDSAMSSDALLMNLFCTPQVIESLPLRSMLGVETQELPVFGWKARVPLANGRVDRTEVDMRWGNLLIEAKLTEGDFQCREIAITQSYRDFDTIFDRDLLPRMRIRTRRRRQAFEFPEEFTQEWETSREQSEQVGHAFRNEIEARADAEHPWEVGYRSYQLIRNVLAAYATQASFCVIHDQRRPDLNQAWFEVLRAVKGADMRTRLKVLTWQEIVPYLPGGLCDFLDRKYGIVRPASLPSPLEELESCG